MINKRWRIVTGRRNLSAFRLLTLLVAVLPVLIILGIAAVTPRADSTIPTGIVPTDVSPESDTVPGPSGGEFGVTDDGAASYALPLWTPDGPTEPRPDLVLRYNSRAGNGIAGMGWRLAGLSQIRRCPKTVAHDFTASPVLYSEPQRPGVPTYALCLDGRHLQPIFDGTPSSKAYFVPDDPRIRITVEDFDTLGPIGFRVSLEDGRVLTFGATADARLEGPRVSIVGLENNSGWTESWETVRLAWSVSRIEDRYGNTLSISYETSVQPDQAIQHRLKQITYLPREGGPSLRLIRFEYEDRPDPISEFVGRVTWSKPSACRRSR